MGGDGGAVQYCMQIICALGVNVDISHLDFVGYWPSQNSVVVAHQGTDPFNAFVVISSSDNFPSSSYSD